ncbi:unnamed protein product [Urochloa decumbens]|uniref:Uncharacterized protein n=1 Tax=Urochloa decumbens TaxID=240449 RepID=A0ABC9CN94_9POAL
MEMDLDVAAAKRTKRPAAAVQDLEDDEERRLEEELRTKAPKGNFWAVHPPEISEVLRQTRILRIRTAACIASSVKCTEDFSRRYYEKTPDSAAVTSS